MSQIGPKTISELKLMSDTSSNKMAKLGGSTYTLEFFKKLDEEGANDLKTLVMQVEDMHTTQMKPQTGIIDGWISKAKALPLFGKAVDAVTDAVTDNIMDTKSLDELVAGVETSFDLKTNMLRDVTSECVTEGTLLEEVAKEDMKIRESLQETILLIESGESDQYNELDLFDAKKLLSDVTQRLKDNVIHIERRRMLIQLASDSMDNITNQALPMLSKYKTELKQMADASIINGINQSTIAVTEAANQLSLNITEALEKQISQSAHIEKHFQELTDKTTETNLASSIRLKKLYGDYEEQRALSNKKRYDAYKDIDLPLLKSGLKY